MGALDFAVFAATVVAVVDPNGVVGIGVFGAVVVGVFASGLDVGLAANSSPSGVAKAVEG